MNKMDRMQAVLQGKTPDVVPAGFWFHYRPDYSVEQMVESHLELYRRTDMDIIKVMQDYPYPLEGQVKTVSDWKQVRMLGKTSPEYKKLEEVLKRILDATQGEVMVFQTMFGPFKAAVMKFGDALVMEHSRQDPQDVADGVRRIGEGLREWADGYLDAGAAGIYYSAQFGEVGRFTQEEWEQLVRPSDEMVLGAADSRTDKYNILHICGEPEYDFKVHLERFADYPGDLVNWSIKDNGLSLKQGQKLYRRPVLGGMNNKGTILTGTVEEIRQEAEAAIRGFGSTSMMLGADCTIQGANISIDKIQTAVEAAHGFRG